MEDYTTAVNAESASAENNSAEDTSIAEPIGTTPLEEPEGSIAASDGEESQEGKKIPAAEKRIKQLLSKQKQAWEQAQSAREEAQFWKAQAQASAPQGIVEIKQEPHIDDFDTYEDFLVAKTRHELQESQRQENIRREQEQVDAAFRQRIDKAAESNPDIYSVLNDSSLPVSPVMGLVIKNSENAPEVLMYLGEHREEAAKIARLDPIGAVKELGKLELKIINAAKPEPVRKVSLAPEPIKPLEATGPMSMDLEKVSMQEFMQNRNKGMVTGRLKRR